MQIDYSAIWKQNTAHFLLGEWSLHGPNHWRNVELNGLQLCQLNGADETVVRLFAVFHDVERHNEGHDPDHGRRAADLIETLHGDAFQISPEKLQLLLNACRFHKDGSSQSWHCSRARENEYKNRQGLCHSRFNCSSYSTPRKPRNQRLNPSGGAGGN